MSYSYATAKAALSEGERDRILAMWFSSDELVASVDWDKATQAFGAASVNSMKVSYRNLVKKIDDAGGKTGVTAPSTAAVAPVPSTPKTPRSKAGRPAKRKAETAGSDEDEDAPKSLRKKAVKNTARGEDEDDNGETVTKNSKKVGRPRKTPVKKPAVTKQTGDDEDVADNIDAASDKVESTQKDSENLTVDDEDE